MDALDRSTLTISGSNVSSWYDKSGTTTLSQGNAVSQPTYEATGFNGRPTLRFVAQGGWQELVSASTTAYSGITSLFIFFVGRVITPFPGSFPSPISLINKVSFYLRGGLGGGAGTDIWTYNGGSFVSTSNSYFPYDENHLVCLALTGGKQQFILDASSGSPQVNFTFGGATSVNVRIGGSGYNGSDGYNGYLSEVLLYTSALTPSQRQQVENYLATKWGLRGNLPSTSWTKLYRSLSPAFTPIQLSGLSVWFDAMDAATVTRTGSNVSQWVDKSGSSNHGTGQGSPTYNGSNAVSFSGSGQYFTLPNGAYPYNNSSYSYFLIFTSTTVVPDNTMVFGGGWGTNQALGIRAANNSTAGIMNYWFANDLATSSPYIYTSNVRSQLLASYTSGGQRSVWVNFALGATDTPGTRSQPSTSNFLGNSPINTYYSGQMHEFLVFSTALSASQRHVVEGYLAWKWGLTGNLASNHPFKTVKP
jgi:hypothetical protein